MITIFNRRELFITFNTNKQSRIRKILEDNNIDYTTKTVNRMSPLAASAGSRGRVGTIGQNLDTMYEYIIYVHKSDYEKAAYLIGR